MKKKTLTEALVLEDFQNAVVYLTLHKIKERFKNATRYTLASKFDKASKLHIDYSILDKLSRFEHKHCLTYFIEKSAHMFTFHKHVDKKYASGNSISISSWFELKIAYCAILEKSVFKINTLDEVLKDKYYMDLSSERYSARLRKTLKKLLGIDDERKAT